MIEIKNNTVRLWVLPALIILAIVTLVMLGNALIHRSLSGYIGILFDTDVPSVSSPEPSRSSIDLLNLCPYEAKRILLDRSEPTCVGFVVLKSPINRDAHAVSMWDESAKQGFSASMGGSMTFVPNGGCLHLVVSNRTAESVLVEVFEGAPETGSNRRTLANPASENTEEGGSEEEQGEGYKNSSDGKSLK